MAVTTGLMEPAARPPAGTPRKPAREKAVVAVALLFSWATFLLIQYDRMRTMGPGAEEWIRAKLAGNVFSEGDQFRIALPLFARFLEVHTRLKPIQSLPLLEAACYGLMLLLLYLQFSWSPQMRSAQPATRLAALGLFLAAVQFPILWIFPWERPETLPTAFYLALITLLSIHYQRVTFPVAALTAIVLSIVQASARGDAAIIAGVGIILFAFAFARELPRSPRLRTAILGLCCLLPGVLTQKFLEHRFPLHPGQTKWTFQLFTNLNLAYGPNHIPILLTALTPLAFTLYLVWRKKVPVDASTRLALLLCVLDIPAYVMMGLVSEVRIYVPYLFLAAPAIGKIWSAFILGGDPFIPANIPATSQR